MARKKITDAFIQKLKAPATGSEIYFGDVAGFGVRISTGGKIVFVYNYRNAQRQQRQIKIGGYPAWTPAAARAKALVHQKAVEDGGDPQGDKEQEREAPTVAELIAEYRNDPERKKKRLSTLRNEDSMLESVVLPRFGSRPVKAITRQDCARLHEVLKATPYRANRVLSLLSTVFTFAKNGNWRDDNPAAAKSNKHPHGIQKYPEEKRQCFLTDEEQGRLEAALDAYPDQEAADVIRLLLFTGAREDEVLSANWEEFKLERKQWTKPAERTKGKETQYAVLSDNALALLRRMEKTKTGVYLFPGNGTGKARTTIRRPWMQICRAAGFVKEIHIAGKRRELIRYKPTLRIHDLRHNFASQLVSKNVDLYLVGDALGHRDLNTTKRYAHLKDAARLEAVNKFTVTNGNRA